MATSSADKLETSFPPGALGMIKRGAWLVFHAEENTSWKFNVGFIPVSVKIAKLKPMWEMLFGPDPVLTTLD